MTHRERASKPVHECPTCRCVFADSGVPPKMIACDRHLLQKVTFESETGWRGECGCWISKPTRFQPGMRIAPGHGRASENVLVRLIQKIESNQSELWEIKPNKDCIINQNWFYPDDLQRVIEEKPHVSEEQAEVELQKEKARVIGEKPRCIGYNGGCDGDLVATPHEKDCPCYESDRVGRPYLYVSSEPVTPPQPEWKAGQMVVLKQCGNSEVVKLIACDTEGWFVKRWIVVGNISHWGVEEVAGYGMMSSRYYEPYPRVGDWVRYTNVGKTSPFQWNEAWPTDNLEPASPPVEPIISGNVESNNRTPLEGESWEEVLQTLEGVNDKDDHMARCIIDLRDEFRRLVEAMKEHNAR